MKKKYVKVFTRVCYFSLIDFLISHNVEYLLYMDVTPIHRYPYSQIPPIHRFHLYTYTDTPNTQIPLYMDVTPIHRYPYTQIPPIHRFHLYTYTDTPIHGYLIYTDTSYTQIPHIHRYLIYIDTLGLSWIAHSVSIHRPCQYRRYIKRNKELTGNLQCNC